MTTEKASSQVIDQSLTQATPRPWKAAGTSIVTDEHCIAVIEDDGEYAAPSEERKANAALIVRAVNSHDALYAVARTVVDKCKCLSTLTGRPPGEHPGCLWCAAYAALVVVGDEPARATEGDR